MFQDRILLTPKDILEKEFKIDTRGYRPQEVDKFLDEVISDYDEMISMIKDLEREKKDLIDENIRLKQEVRNARTKLDVLRNVSPTEVSNADLLRRLSNQDLKIGVYGASTVNEETNMGGAYFAAAGIKPTLAIACDVTFATDYPHVNKAKYGDITLDGGPVLAKGAPINRQANRLLEQSAKALSMNVQYELTPAMTGTDADRMRLTGKGVPIALVSLPLRYMHSPVETASMQDIEQEIELLVHMLTHLNGKESLNPLDL